VERPGGGKGVSLLRGKKWALHQQPRQTFDWYRETRESVESLFDAVHFDGTIHDPACGLGRIVEVARDRGYEATGADIADYGIGEAGVDFLADDRPRDSLAFNAPYKLNEPFIKHAFAHAKYQIAARADPVPGRPRALLRALCGNPAQQRADPEPAALDAARRFQQPG
jgi:hypothetical protein